MRVLVNWQGGMGTYLLLLGVFIAFGFVIYLMLRDPYEQFRLDFEGVETRGYVTDRYITEGDDSTTYTLTYRYDIGFGDPPNWIRDSQDVGPNFYNDHLIEDELRVWFVPDAPDISRVQNKPFERLLILIVVLIFVGIESFLLYVMLPRIRIKKS